MIPLLMKSYYNIIVTLEAVYLGIPKNKVKKKSMYMFTGTEEIKASFHKVFKNIESCYISCPYLTFGYGVLKA